METSQSGPAWLPLRSQGALGEWWVPGEPHREASCKMNSFSWDLPGVGGLIRLPCSGHISYRLCPHQPICFLAPLKVNSLDNQWPKLRQDTELPKRRPAPPPLPIAPHHKASFIHFFSQLFFGLVFLFFSFFFLSLLWHTGSSILVAACGVSFPDQESNPGPLHWERGVLATGPPGKSHQLLFTEDLKLS